MIDGKIGKSDAVSCQRMALKAEASRGDRIWSGLEKMSILEGAENKKRKQNMIVINLSERKTLSKLRIRSFSEVLIDSVSDFSEAQKIFYFFGYYSQSSGASALGHRAPGAMPSLPECCRRASETDSPTGNEFHFATGTISNPKLWQLLRVSFVYKVSRTKLAIFPWFDSNER